IVRRRALDGEGLFDGEFFMYGEELDLSLRLRGRGFTIVYVPTAVVHHKGMQSIKRASHRPQLFQQYYCNRNRVKILATYYPPSVLLRSLPLVCLSLAYWDAVFLLQGGPGLFIRAVKSQVEYARRGVIERLRGKGVPAERWLPWMTDHTLRQLLAVRAQVVAAK